MKIKALLVSTFSLSIFLSGISFADVPVLDYGQNVYKDTDDSSLGERLKRIENRLTSVDQVKLLQQIDALQKTVQHLQGEIEVQRHQLAKLSQHTARQSTVAEKVTPYPIKVSKSDEETSVYQSGISLLKDRQYHSAEAVFKKIIKQYPDGKYVINAHYWLGELYMVQNQQKDARKQFSLVINNYPKNHKTADAMLKLAELDKQENHLGKAKQGFEALVAKYPDSTAAQLAQAELDQLS